MSKRMAPEGRRSTLAVVWLCAALGFNSWAFSALWQLSPRSPRGDRALRRAETQTVHIEEATDMDPDRLSAQDYPQLLCGKLHMLTGRTNVTAECLEYKVLDARVGTEVQLKLPVLQYYQYVQGKGRILRKRKLPAFTATAESLQAAKEAAAKTALESLFRRLNTTVTSSNNRGLAKLMASVFSDGVEVAEVRFEADYNNTDRSPGNILYSLAYLSRESEPEEASENFTKRVLTTSRAIKLGSWPWTHQVAVQHKQRLVMPKNVSVFKVAVKTPPDDLSKRIYEELRAKDAVKLQVAGTLAAQQALLALARLEITHRFSCYFMKSNFENVTGLEVQVARRWRPLY